MNFKTERGLRVHATQRSNRDEGVPVRDAMLEADRDGLRISAELGDGRGFAINVVVMLEEIVAWMPDLLAERSRETVRQSREAVRRAEQDMRARAASEAKALGVDLPFLPGGSSEAEDR